MYSLGIVFFEMWYIFSTGHERVEILSNLRNNMLFPPNFEDTHPRQARIIRWLMQRDPNLRPTAQDLLKSDLMPPKMEDEYMRHAMRVLTQPSSPFYNQLLSSLFSSSISYWADAPPPIGASKSIGVACSRLLTIRSCSAYYSANATRQCRARSPL